MKGIILFLIPFLVSSSVQGLSCGQCRRYMCHPPEGCAGGLTKDVCHCCDECAKVVNETCGGPWNIAGNCDVGLVCYIDPLLTDYDRFNSEGKCVESGCEEPRVYSRCYGGCIQTCDDDPTPSCEHTCTGGCVCPYGMIQKSSNDTTCIEKEKCPNLCTPPKVFTYCNGHCHPTCEDPSPECPEICTEGCTCPYGMVLNPEDDTCISIKECPNTDAPTSVSIRTFSPALIFAFAICITICVCIVAYFITHKTFSVSKRSKGYASDYQKTTDAVYSVTKEDLTALI